MDHIVKEFQDLQDDICAGIEALDGKARFEQDTWVREGGGGGRSRVIRNGSVFEKGGVNFSHVFGQLPDVITQKLGLPKGVDFDATGVSIVIHPESPKQPIIHMNVRYFQTGDGTHWFGGGIDLTPIYVVPEDAKFFHQSLKDTCDKFSPTYYPEFKEWCDKYFFIKHRNETRGIGGIFFDHLKADTEEKKADHFDFVMAVGRTFVPAYAEIINRHKGEEVTETNKQFHLLRRSRYVEFNLVYDKGTKFGLDTNGRTESILMSMPPLAGWEYNWEAPAGSEEAQTIAMLKPQDWV
ncbi:oxygen-dependent coproporphyrinogen oxidase [Pontibacter sp. G13]|uniref:oxygen-dependent coproporphyrinogen oxidase n=1 Tax=Pontibacter sp. G13 TaxID=3074898 RepID=UPI0028898D58|nr:oxygen-dependent coproporphyrinogen oxidase [Pontibacter sp. G13]WNJ17937.1 oxygen-dependent coproporphyrinogen oxidase [Pontibacter sp. G13]